MMYATLPILVSILAATPGTRFVNANVFDSEATSFVVADGVMHADPYDGPIRREVDLQGGFVVPRLVDAHAHVLGLGKALERVDLNGARSWREAVARARAQAPEKGWVLGRGWDQNDWKDKSFPTHEALTRAFPTRPVALTRVDGHAMVVNRRAMKIAGLDEDTETPPGGRILREGKGSRAPTGLLIDAAMDIVRKAIEEPGPEERARLIVKSLKHCASLGLTGIHDMGIDRETLAVYRKLDTEGRLPLRVWGYTGGVIDGVGPYSGDRFKLVGAKLFADGALGSRGAALLEPYSDDDDWSGHLIHEPEELKRQAAAAARAGLQVAIHAIGDRGVRVALDALEASKGTKPGRVEHAQVVAEADFARFKALGVVASMQPTHATSDMPWARARVGPKRLEGAYAWRTMLRLGVPLVFGSDFPVEKPDPRLGIYAAVSRADLRGVPIGGWMPRQKVTIDEAIRAFSTTPSAVIGEVGPQPADFTVFARDLRKVNPKEIPEVKVHCVVVGGRIVYEAP